MGGVKDAKAEWFNPVLRVEKRRQARESISNDTATVFLDLCRENKVPAWVLKEVDLGQMRLAAE